MPGCHARAPRLRGRTVSASRSNRLGTEFARLLRPRGDRSWVGDAACRGMDTNLFFPSSGQSHAEAEAVCATCPVMEQCRAYGMADEHGIWGGLSERERRRKRRQERDPTWGQRPSAPKPAPKPSPPARTPAHDGWLIVERRA